MAESRSCAAGTLVSVNGGLLECQVNLILLAFGLNRVAPMQHYDDA